MRYSRENLSIVILVVFHLIGAIGLGIDELKPLFLSLTPFNLLLSFVLLLWSVNNFSLSFLKVIIFIYILAFFVEVVGVKTSILFGSYQYGHALGFKVLDTPLIIGINWLILLSATYSVSSYFIKHSLLKILLSSILMVLLDVLIEPVAISLNFWTWSDGLIPLKNYLMWMLLSLFMNWIYSFNAVKIGYKIGFGLLLSQILFFTIQTLYL